MYKTASVLYYKLTHAYYTHSHMHILHTCTYYTHSHMHILHTCTYYTHSHTTHTHTLHTTHTHTCTYYTHSHMHIHLSITISTLNMKHWKMVKAVATTAWETKYDIIQEHGVHPRRMAQEILMLQNRNSII